MSISEHATGNSPIKGAVPHSTSNTYSSSVSSSSSSSSSSTPAVNSTHKSKTSSSSSSASGLPAAVSHIYYKHGLFLSSYPTCATSIAIVAILFSCYPLINIPLPGTIPTKIVLPFDGKNSLFGEGERSNFSMVKNIFNVNNVSYEPHVPWAQNSPILYVQQITLRSSVLPWTDDMQLMDAFRAPLYEVFRLLEIVRNHESTENQRTLDKICLRVDNVKRSQNEQIFPEYDCLVLSPANLWGQSIQNFTGDTNILNTIFQYHNLQKTKVSTAEMLFGLPIQDTGFKRYPLRSRSRIIQFALTLILKQNDREYIQSLKEKLLNYYPPPQINQGSSQTTEQQQQNEKSSITYIFYPGEFKMWEFLPLTIAFVLLFTYVYFSVRKIDVIRSRFLLALCAAITILGSLVMSLGLCFFFGLTISLQSKDIFPYLVILLGLENCLVITRSVVSTDETFDVKIRVAQALSKEGWHISKTLLTEITILTIGLATFVPVIQEFCVFAIVGLLSDYMLQMLLFSTILAMNIKRPEYSTEAKHLPKMMLSFTGNSMAASNHSPTSGGNGYGFSNGRPDFRFFGSASPANGSAAGGSNGVFSPPPFGSFHRSQSHPKLAFADFNNLNNANDMTKRSSIALSPNNNGPDKIPKRLKIVNFWARTRFFQRAFMVWMSVWICSIIYNSGYLENLFVVDSNHTGTFRNDDFQRNWEMGRGAVSSFFSNVHSVINAGSFGGSGQDKDQAGSPVGGSSVFGNKAKSSGALNAGHEGPRIDNHINETEAELKRLLYPDFELNYFLSNFHWPTIMKQYNVSLRGHYITILPTIKLSHAISPEKAVHGRNPYEKVVQNFQWKALAAALDPLDFNDDENRESPMVMPGGTPLFPKSPMEIFFAITLCCISVFVLCYTMVVFYRCICTRNYAEWRSSWNECSEFSQKTEQILEGVPTQIAGHKHRIECLVSDGANIISCCLKGQIKVWDARSGENITTINRGDMQVTTHREDGEVIVKKLNASPVWCLDYFDNLIAVGCANGRIELWEMPSGVLKCTYHEDSKRNQGITHINLNGDRVIVARLCGRLDFYRLETYYKGKQIDWGFTSAYRRTHVRTNSTGSIGLMLQQQQQQQQQRNDSQRTTKEEMKCTLRGVRLAHQQPITCMEVVNDMVFTGSQDHTLKVYSLNSTDVEYTLHGHCGPITCLFVDRWQPGTGGSGSQDGLLCVWDLFTGACMYNIQAHDGAVSCLACAPSYVISLGTDERICVWERFQGNLLTTISISNAYSSLLMLTPSLLVTSKMGSLIVWDVRTGEPAREVRLDFSNLHLCPKIMMLAYDSVVCDYGNEIRVVRFPIVADKSN
ncbi:sterol regulatory element-binding protein cleavage-activating protein [Lucilia cuprina]|uniref:sterol regulatory element-binding protein cleavage-activating protein n=1 Tax=Lucilia cuprina TaxID=7375 RepID=UPI001F05ACD5|nr:sterol regulatory element-binding protein cleavage-activating protein [Lucilia cuprina]